FLHLHSHGEWFTYAGELAEFLAPEMHGTSREQQENVQNMNGVARPVNTGRTVVSQGGWANG
ncbi:hypothetical protein, partial [Lactococcus petauri]|uniref:hypothetical protein n=1 Tax=Lactococcus petauri TaxID=1940789 RepID=UPI0021F1F3A3